MTATVMPLTLDDVVALHGSGASSAAEALYARSEPPGSGVTRVCGSLDVS